MKKFFILTALVIGLIITLYFPSCTGSESNGLANTDRISYNFQVRPILSDKCFNCHGPDANKRQAGLRLDIAEDAYKALKEHPRAHAIVPGDPLQSELYLRVSSTDTAYMMPPVSSNLPALTSLELAIIKKWIEQGGKYEKHWAFVPPVKPALPKVDDKLWAKNEIDYFILNELEKRNLQPNVEADRERLLKRLSFDLTGLPPAPQQTQRFVADNSPTAYEKMVDELMGMPQYGERMAIDWLDVARFADSHGYQDDNYRSQWPWRDWLIHALNENMPYDQFITWQMAGDLLPKPTKEQLLATGFNRNHKITEEGGVIDEEYRVEYVSDRTNTFGRAIIGISMECAKCHDHKFDPISQKDYYSLFAFFNNVKEVGLESTVGGPETFAKNPRMQISKEDKEGILSYINMPDTNRVQVSVMGESDTLRKTFVLDRGNYDQPTKEVAPSMPDFILPFPQQYERNRLGLSRWLFDVRNPLTSRVYVNRLWQQFFGRGIVRSTADFGMQGELPSHPGLLDWLAVDFREHGWSMKYMVKKIVMSGTYRQSAEVSKENLQDDPENIYLSRAPRLRVPAEMVRDIVLSSAGLLNPSIGGPSVKPYQPPGLWEMATSGRGLLANYEEDTGPLYYRRGIYTFIKRTVPPPGLMIFDGSNRDQCEVKRSRTNTPLQALVMMNDPTVLEASLALADQLLQKQSSPAQAVSSGFEKIICRKPAQKEMDILTGYYNEKLAGFEKDPRKATKAIKVGYYKPATTSKPELAALMQVMQVIYNMEEAITKT
jgi:hypothetical protein